MSSVDIPSPIEVSRADENYEWKKNDPRGRLPPDIFVADAS